MERSKKKDLYKSHLKRELVYVVFMASNETDLSLLPEPVTLTEKRLMELCEEKVDAIKTAKFRPADSEHPEGLVEEISSVKKTSTRRTTKKAAGK